MVFAPAPWCEDIKGFWWCRMDRNSPCRTPAGSKHPETLAKESVETVSICDRSRKLLAIENKNPNAE